MTVLFLLLKVLLFIYKELNDALINYFSRNDNACVREYGGSQASLPFLIEYPSQKLKKMAD